jgi:hypothetical protein
MKGRIHSFRLPQITGGSRTGTAAFFVEKKQDFSEKLSIPYIDFPFFALL